MFDNSEAIAAIEVVILLTISSSIDIKKNYFANSCNSNAGSMEVEGFLPSSYVDNIHQGKKTTRTTPNEKKQYSTVIYCYVSALALRPQVMFRCSLNSLPSL